MTAPRARTKPDACRLDCEIPRCGDYIVDTGEDCDAGPSGDATCSKKCKAIAVPDSGGCASGDSSGGSALVMLVIGVVLVARRRTRS